MAGHGCWWQQNYGWLWTVSRVVGAKLYGKSWVVVGGGAAKLRLVVGAARGWLWSWMLVSHDLVMPGLFNILGFEFNKNCYFGKNGYLHIFWF